MQARLLYDHYGRKKDDTIGKTVRWILREHVSKAVKAAEYFTRTSFRDK
jgi:hypothetical protein